MNSSGFGKARKNVTKHRNIKKINFDDVRKEKWRARNPHWPEIPNHTNRILRARRSGLGEKANALLNLINP